MNWLYGAYPDPWKTILRVATLVFVVVFSLNFWGPVSNTVVTIILLSIIVFQFAVTRYLRSKL
jgi:hypothetical protein